MSELIYVIHKPTTVDYCDTLEHAICKLDRNGGEQISSYDPHSHKEYWRITCGKFLWTCDPDKLLDNELAIFVLNAPCVEDNVAYKIRGLAECFGCDVDRTNTAQQAEWVRQHYADQIEIECGGWHFMVNPDEWDGARNRPKKGWWY